MGKSVTLRQNRKSTRPSPRRHKIAISMWSQKTKRRSDESGAAPAEKSCRLPRKKKTLKMTQNGRKENPWKSYRSGSYRNAEKEDYLLLTEKDNLLSFLAMKVKLASQAQRQLMISSPFSWPSRALPLSWWGANLPAPLQLENAHAHWLSACLETSLNSLHSAMDQLWSVGSSLYQPKRFMYE